MKFSITPQLSGIIAIIMWSCSPLIITYTGGVPAFLLATLTLFIAFLLTVFKWLTFKENPKEYFSYSLSTYILGVAGIGGYLVFWYLGFKFSPAIEANLLNYMWPILIILFSSFLYRDKLKIHHILGIIISFIGCVFVITQDLNFAFKTLYIPGYCAAFLGAIIWALYSTLTRRFSFKPETVAVFCLFSALITLCFHLTLETTYWPQNPLEWGAVLLLGFTRISFMFWDYAMKKGHVKTIASFAYCIPIFSTILLVIFNRSPFYTNLLWGTILIISGLFITNASKIKESLFS
ncbi:MAG: DMT family transporter [Alphaproteobacteria bacterium]